MREAPDADPMGPSPECGDLTERGVMTPILPEAPLAARTSMATACAPGRPNEARTKAKDEAREANRRFIPIG